MAKFEGILPTEMILDLQEHEKHLDEITDEMLEEAAKAVKKRMQRNMRRVFKSTKSLEKGLKITKTYYTRSDRAKNIKVGFYGYDADTKSAKYPKGRPIPLIALAREYGTKSGEAKRPFIRTAVQEIEVERAMSEVMDKYLTKELKNE